MTLRPYQETFVSDLLVTLRDLGKQAPVFAPDWPAGEPHPCGVVGQLATGGGKTHSAAELIHRALAGALPGVRRAAFWADLREITSDTAARFASSGLDVGVYAATAPKALQRPGAQVQVVQVQTATRRGEAPPADLIVLDEAHISEGADLAEALRRAAPRYLVGITATPSRGDGKGLGRTFRALVQGPQTGELQAAGHLVPCDVVTPAKGYLTRGLAMDPVEAVLRYRGREGVRVLCFCADGQARDTAARFCGAGYRAEVLAADTRPKVRETQRARLTGGELDVLVTVDCAVKGWDCPAVETVVLARGVSVPGVYLQMIGRALRPSPSTGKTRATVLDLRGVVWLHGLPEEPRRWSLGDEAVVVAQSAQVRYQRCLRCAWLGTPPGPMRPCPRCGATLGSPIKPPAVLRAEKMHRYDAMTPEQRRRAVEASARGALTRAANRMPEWVRARWVEKKVAERMRNYDAKESAK